MKKISEEKSDQRTIYEKIQIVVGITFAIVFFFAYGTGRLEPPQNFAIRMIIYFSVPSIIFFLYLSSIKKVFPQRIGDCLHSLLVIFILSTFAMLYGERIGGFFIFLFFLVIVLFSLLSDPFLPVFIGAVMSLILLAEYLYVNILSQFNFLSFIKLTLQIISLLIIGFTSSNLVKKTTSEQQKSKELKHAYKNIKELSGMKTEFLRVVNHQLRTPVSIIKGMSSMLAEGTLPKKKQEEFIKKLYLSSERLHTILDDILVAQNLAGSPASFELRPCKIEEIIEKLVNHQKSIAEAKGLEIVFSKPKEKIPIVLLDEEIVNRVVSRLIDNAILYTDKGKIDVSLNLKKERDGKFIQISVKDSGIGLDKKDKKNLFKLFHRGEKATSLHPNGSGLGLFIVKSLIESHKGSVRAESKGRGKGSVFIIKLPFMVEV